MMAEHKGGTMRLVASAAGTIDPQVNYTLQYWQLYQVIYDGLMALQAGRRRGGLHRRSRPGRGACRSRTDGGKTYTFKLRTGIKFSNGQDVTVKDVVASFQRIFKVSGPTSGTFYAGIVGADACLKDGATCTLDGGVVGDEAAGTVTFHLVAPDPEFFDKLAVPHAAVAAGRHACEDVGTTPIPGTGAYMIDELRSQQAAEAGAQPALQGVERGRPAGRLSRRDRLRLRPDRRGRGDRGGERRGGLDVRPAPDRPARRDRHASTRTRSTSTR